MKKKRWLNETNFWAVHWTHLQVKLLSLWSKAGCSCSRAGLQPPPTCCFIRMQSLPNPVVSKWSRLAYYLKVWRAFFNPDHFDWFGLEKDCMRSYVCRHQPHSSGDTAQPLWAWLGFKAFEPGSAASQAAHLATAVDTVRGKKKAYEVEFSVTDELCTVRSMIHGKYHSASDSISTRRKDASTNGPHFQTKLFILGQLGMAC